jgi:nucleoside-diphosphate-sugar epimerase
VEGIFRLFHADGHEPVNIGNPVEYTIGQLAERILRVVAPDAGVTYLPLPTDDPKVRQPDITRARTILGWEPAVTLEEGLTNTIAYFRSLHEHDPLKPPPVITEAAEE